MAGNGWTNWKWLNMATYFLNGYIWLEQANNNYDQKHDPDPDVKI